MPADPLTDLSEQRAAERRLAAFADTLAGIRFFAAAGTPTAADAGAKARAYLDGLGLSRVTVAVAASLDEALALIRRSDISPEWQRAEDAARAEITARTDALLGQSRAAHLLNDVMRRASEAASDGAARLAAGSDDPEAVKRAAAGAIIQAAYEAALATAADAPAEHPFHHKFALFGAGRWPLSVIGGAFHIL